MKKKPVKRSRTKQSQSPITPPKQAGLRYNSDKPRMSLIDPYAITELAKVLTQGAEKYAAHNWRKGLKISECIDSLERHTAAFNDAMQSDLDPETQLHHMSHVMCNAMFIVWLQKYRPDCDDRWKPTLESPAYVGVLGWPTTKKKAKQLSRKVTIERTLRGR